jgi:hypothetical protein
MRSRRTSSHLLPNGDHERSTVYQVREAARHDLYTQEISRRNTTTSRRRPRSRDNGKETNNRTTNYPDDSTTTTTMAAPGLNTIDYTSRPVTPAHSNWSSRSLHSSDASNRPESLESETTERPSTAAAFLTDNSNQDNLHPPPLNATSPHPSTSTLQHQHQQGSRYGAAHQRQKKRSQQRRDKKARKEERQKARGMHDQPATSWSWAKEDTTEGKKDAGGAGNAISSGNDSSDDDGSASFSYIKPQWTPVVRDMLRCLSGMSSSNSTLQQRLEHVRSIE